jgi:hypothetical protein
MAGAADKAQDFEEFNYGSSKHIFTNECRGRQEYYQQLRVRNEIPEGICAVCGQKPVRDGYETCSTGCSNASKSERELYARSYAKAMALP